LGLAETVKGTGVVSHSVSPSFSISALVPGAGAVTTTAIKATTISASVSGVGLVFVTADKARSVSASISGIGAVTNTYDYTINTSARITSRGRVGAAVGGAISVDVQVLGIGEVVVNIQTTRPEPITNFRISSRVGASVTLVWIDGIRTDKVEVWRSVGARNTFARVATVTNGSQTYTDSVNSTETYAYQLIPISATSAKGKSTNIIYTATTKVI